MLVLCAQVNFIAKLDSGEKATFFLRYEEMLERSANGLYHYDLNIHPNKEQIEDFHIAIQIDDTLPIKDISVNKNSEDITDQVYKSDNSAPNRWWKENIIFFQIKMYQKLVFLLHI